MEMLSKLSLIMLLVCFSQSVEHSLFSRQTLCDVEKRIANACSTLVSPVRSLLECLTFCGNRNTCLGASVTQSLHCYLHVACSQVSSCSKVSAGHKYFSKNCENNGVWNPTKVSCKCVDGWVGPRCNELPKSCDDLITSGYSTAPYRVTLDLSDKNLPNTEVLCWIKATNPTFSVVLLMKNSGRVRHDKEWNIYQLGYYSGASHLWLGLDNWHILSKAGYNTLTVMAHFYLSGGCEFRWNYYNFLLSSENDDFAFTFDSASNVTTGCDSTPYTMGDCLGPLQNVSFSTRNRDNDQEMFQNCAENIGAGWWYSMCNGPCNLMGWSHGYKDMVLPERLIRLVGIDMNALGPSLGSLEMHLKTPQGLPV